MASFNSSVMLLVLALAGLFFPIAAGIPVQGRAPGEDAEDNCLALPGCLHHLTSLPHFIPCPTKAKISALPVTPTFHPLCSFGPAPHNDLCRRDPEPAEEVFPDNWSLLHHSLPGHPTPSYEGHHSLILPTSHPIRPIRPIRPIERTVLSATITRPARASHKSTPTNIASRTLIGHPSKLVSAAKCTTTVYVNKPFELDPTSTAYASTSTSISQVPCGCCALATINRGSIGPVVHFTTTVTAQQTKTVDVIQCSPQLSSN